MKTTIRIALAELRSLFCSPIAWLILVIFAFQSGLAFSDAIGRQIQSQAMGYGLWGATSSMFTGWMGIFPGLLGNLYLYIPLLTMGLMSREYSSGSIKLLYSSPVTNPQIILGKYLSVLVYNLALIFPLLVMAVFTGLTVKDADLPLVFSGILGIYLLICAYGAIGLFMSSITSYQVVAAMGTLAVLAALNYVGEVGQDYAFVRDITYWLSISGRAYQFIDGLICTEDVLYFLIVIVLFISLSILKLRAGRSKVSRARSWGTYTAVVAAAFLVGYLSTLPSLKFYYDCTATKSNTLTRTSQDIVKKLDGGLTITTYVNLLEPNYGSGLPSPGAYTFIASGNDLYMFDRTAKSVKKYLSFDAPVTAMCGEWFNSNYMGLGLENGKFYLLPMQNAKNLDDSAKILWESPDDFGRIVSVRTKEANGWGVDQF